MGVFNKWFSLFENNENKALPSRFFSMILEEKRRKIKAKYSKTRTAINERINEGEELDRESNRILNPILKYRCRDLQVLWERGYGGRRRAASHGPPAKARVHEVFFRSNDSSSPDTSSFLKARRKHRQ